MDGGTMSASRHFCFVQMTGIYFPAIIFQANLDIRKLRENISRCKQKGRINVEWMPLTVDQGLINLGTSKWLWARAMQLGKERICEINSTKRLVTSFLYLTVIKRRGQSWAYRI